MMNAKPLPQVRSHERGTFFTLGISFLYSCFVVFFPWEFIRRDPLGEGWHDYNWYVDYFNSNTLTLIEQRGWTNIVQFLTGEALWDLCLVKLTDITNDAAISLRIVSFFICFVWGLFLFGKIPIHLALTFLLNPVSVTIAMDVIRNGFAWSLVILSLMLTQRWLQPLKFLICLATPFIHTLSAPLLLLVFNPFISWIRLSKKLYLTLLATLPGVTIALLLTVFNAASAVGDRRADYGYASEGGGSRIEMLFWFILFIIQLSCSSSYIKKHGLAIGIIAWYLIMNLYVSWSYRLWSATIPLMAYAIWGLPINKRNSVIILWLGYLLLQYIYWTPLLDWLDLGNSGKS